MNQEAKIKTLLIGSAVYILYIHRSKDEVEDVAIKHKARGWESVTSASSTD